MIVLPRPGAIALGPRHPAPPGPAAHRPATSFEKYIDAMRDSGNAERARTGRARAAARKDKAEAQPDERDSDAAQAEARESQSPAQPEGMPVDVAGTAGSILAATQPITGLPQLPIAVVGEARAARDEAAVHPAVVVEARPAPSEPGSESAAVVASDSASQDAEESRPALTQASGSAEEAEVPVETRMTPRGTALQPSALDDKEAVVRTGGNTVQSTEESTDVPDSVVARTLAESRHSTAPDSHDEHGLEEEAQRNDSRDVLSEKVRLSVEQIKTGSKNGAAVTPSEPHRAGAEARPPTHAEPPQSRLPAPDGTSLPPMGQEGAGIGGVQSLTEISAKATGDSAAGTVGRFLLGIEGIPVDHAASPPGGAGRSAPASAPADGNGAAPAHPRSGATGGDRAISFDAEWKDPADLASAARVLAASGGRGRWSATLRLEPPSLGQLTLQIRMRGDAMSLRVEAQAAAIGQLVGSRMDELREALGAQGIRVDRTDIVVRTEAPAADRAPARMDSGSEGGTARDPGSENGPSGDAAAWDRSDWAGSGGMTGNDWGGGWMPWGAMGFADSPPDERPDAALPMAAASRAVHSGNGSVDLWA